MAKTVHERGDRLPLLYQHWPDCAIGRLANLEIYEADLQ